MSNDFARVAGTFHGGAGSYVLALAKSYSYAYVAGVVPVVAVSTFRILQENGNGILTQSGNNLRKE